MQNPPSIGDIAGTIISARLLQEHFKIEQALSIDVTTRTGSVYVVDLMSGGSSSFEFDGSTYCMRRGAVVIDGALNADVLVGLSEDAITILLTDDEYRPICNPSPIAGIQLFS